MEGFVVVIFILVFVTLVKVGSILTAVVDIRSIFETFSKTFVSEPWYYNF